jgi:two-component system LytT family response regulator
MDKLKALIVDDEPPAREGLRLLLARDPDIELIGEAASGQQAVARIRALQPDLVFLDVQMPEME